MIRINVAPDIVIETNFKELLIPVAIIATIAAVFYGGPQIYGALLNSEADELKTKTTEKKEQIQKLKLDVDKLKVLKARLDDSQGRTKQIRSLSSGKKQPVLVLDKLQQLHMERMWLTEVKMASRHITLLGFATDHVIVSEYAKKLKSTGAMGGIDMPDFKSVEPEFSELGAIKTLSTDLTNQNFSSTQPLVFTKINIKKSKTEPVEGLPLQGFELEFDANVP